jgi:hypothetical protein
MALTVVEQAACDGRLDAVQASRRAVLLAAVVTAAGCGKHRRPKQTPRPAAPDAAALVTARNGERLLLASYDAKIAHATPQALPRLQVERAVHATHLAALRGTAASAADIAVVSDIGRALRDSARTLRRLALAAVDGSNAAVLASIAASHAAGPP